MQFIKNLNNIQSLVHKLFSDFKDLKEIINLIDEYEGRTYLVGGAVRDLLLGIKLTDLDIEVHNISLGKLEKILSKFGSVSYVGKFFGVLRLHKMPIDWSLPRKDAPGRKPNVRIDIQMPIKDALLRRDLTMNAMAIDLKTFELIDPFGGIQDIENKVLRSPDIKFFTEDPLRFYRVMQFIGRFDMIPDKKLNDICKKMDISDVSIERIEAEFEKLFLKSKSPSLGIRWIDSIGRLKEILPELAKTKGIEQDSFWHPEKDVFEHLLQSLDASATLEYKNKTEKLKVMYAALCHDLGKVTTTEFIKGRIRSYGHSEEGVSLTRSILKRITRNKNFIEDVCILVKYHMLPRQFVKDNASLAAYRRLALKMKGKVNLQMLAKLALADQFGRNSEGHEPLEKEVDFIQKFIDRAKKAQVLFEYERPILKGNDIIDIVEPGPQMGKMLRYAYEIQMKKGIKNKDKLKEYVIKKFLT